MPGWAHRKDTTINISDAFPSQYMKADVDIPDDRDLIVTMDTVQMEEIGQGENKDSKPCLYFTDYDKALVLNKTNSNTIAGLYGPDTDGWTNKKIALFAQEVDFQGRQVLAIRVRLRKQKATAAPAPPPPKSDEEDDDPFKD